MLKVSWRYSERSTSTRIAITVLATVAVGLIRYALRGVVGDAAPFLPFLAAIIFSAWAGGFWPGVLSTVLSAALGAVLFPAGHTMLELSHPPRGLVAVLFILIGTLFSAVCETMHRSLTRVEAQRKELLAEVANRKSAEAEAARLVRHLTALTDNTPLALVEWDAEFRITRWAGQAEKLFEWTAAEVRGREIFELPLVHEEDREHWEGATARLRDPSNPFVVSRNRNVTRSGRVVTCEWYNSALHDEAGRFVAGLSLVLDVTEREEAVQALREADRRKDEFIATLSHELRNPLAPIRSAVQVLQRKPELDPATQRLCQVIARQTDHMTRLVDELLDLSRITRGKIELQREPVALSPVIQAALEVAGPAIEAGGHRLTLALPPEPLVVRGDAVRLTQTVANLLNNAAKYTPQPGTITLCLEREGHQAVLRVRDTGVGLPPGTHEEIFSMFAQVDRHLGRSQGGLGIGLALVRKLVELHGGTIEARSEGEGRGAEFIVRLPLWEGAAAEPPAGPEPGPTSGPCRIMVVDDNRDAAESLAELLEEEGHHTCTASGGPDALRKFGGFHPQLILLDLGMPGMDGFETLAELRNLPGGREVCVSALTGWGQDEDRRRTRDAGFDHHLTKPVDLHALQELIARVSPFAP